MTVILVTGPSRSGKSEWAEQLATQHESEAGLQVVYVATAIASTTDEEWNHRLQKHIQRRPTHWRTKEVPVELQAVVSQATLTDCLLVDSLGTWLANLIDQSDSQWESTQMKLLKTLAGSDSVIILVAEETGWGVVPAYELGRRFRDRLGNLSRAIGEIADDVYLVTGGYALNLAALGQPVKRL